MKHPATGTVIKHETIDRTNPILIFENSLLVDLRLSLIAMTKDSR